MNSETVRAMADILYYIAGEIDTGKIEYDSGKAEIEIDNGTLEKPNDGEYRRMEASGDRTITINSNLHFTPIIEDQENED